MSTAIECLFNAKIVLQNFQNEFQKQQWFLIQCCGFGFGCGCGCVAGVGVVVGGGVAGVGVVGVGVVGAGGVGVCVGGVGVGVCVGGVGVGDVGGSPQKTDIESDSSLQVETACLVLQLLHCHSVPVKKSLTAKNVLRSFLQRHSVNKRSTTCF